MKSTSRNYPLLLAGQFLGAFGDNFVLAAILGPLTFQLLSGQISEQQVNAQNALFSAVFFVPFILLAPLAGFLNDRLPKSTWLWGGNFLKLLGAGIGFWGVWLHAGDFHASRGWQLAGYAVIALGACVYSPAKYGVLPEILPAERLVKANGTVEMLTLIAILGGLWGGATLYDHVRSLPVCYLATAGLYGGALVLNACMTRTPCNPAMNARDSVSDFGRALRRLVTHARLGRVLLGCGLFWFAGAVLRGNLQAWGLEVLRIAGVQEITNQRLALLKLGLILGVVVGSVLAGRLHRVGDLGGARRYGFGLAVAVLGLGLVGGHAGIAIAVALLVASGLAAGLLLIPLNAALQHETGAGERGKAIAVQNFFDYLAMLLGAGFLQLLTHLGVHTNGVFVALGVTMMGLAVLLRVRKSADSTRDAGAESTALTQPAAQAMRIVPGAHGRRVLDVVLRAVLGLLTRIWFRFRAHGTESLKTPGPVLLVPNHVSWLDWLFLYVVLDDDWKFVAATSTARRGWIHRKIVYSRRNFPIDPNSPQAVRAMTEYLEAGGRLVLFAEGRISTTGALMKLFDGTGFLVRKTNARVITCYLRGANRMPWVRHAGWTTWRPRVSAHFSAAMSAPTFSAMPASQARTRVTQWVRDRMVAQQFAVEQAFGPSHVLDAIAETARNVPSEVALEDATQATLTYRQLMIASDVLAAAWVKECHVGARIGVLLPNVNAMPVTLLSLWRAENVPTILNFSSGPKSMVACAQLAGLRHVITSRGFVEKAKLDVAPFIAAGIELVYLEDVKAMLPVHAKIRAWLRNRFGAANRGVGAARGTATNPRDATAVILFTSGSESTPKGVELTHGNLLANVRQSLGAMDLTDTDRFFNALPLFHSFGLTAGTLLPLIAGCYTFLYPTPLHYRVIPAVVYDRNCTVLLATNTFLNGYARKAHPYDFRTVRYLIAGAEKVQAATLETWARKFGVRILEGYGATECSPVISVNTWIEPKAGSAGRLLPGIDYRLEPVAGVIQGGRLVVRGPNVMKGYLNPEANARFQALDGWYDTGDIAEVDAEGYVRLLGRVKRFAKVSGEMVSLTAVEEALAGAFASHSARCEVAVIARPDEDKGEVLIAFTNEPRLQLAEIRAVLRGKGLSNLAAPRELHVVRSVPKLGTGKVNHRELEHLAVEGTRGGENAPRVEAPAVSAMAVETTAAA